MLTPPPGSPTVTRPGPHGRRDRRDGQAPPVAPNVHPLPPRRSAPPPRPRRRRRTARLGRPGLRLNAGLVAALLALLVVAGRLVQLQGLDTPDYAGAAERQRLRTVVLPAPRGEILDRNGHRLATTVQARTVFADPSLVRDPAGTAAQVGPLLGLDPAAVVELLRRGGQFVPLARGIDPELARRVPDLRLPGIASSLESRRVHPGRDLAASVVGFTSMDGGGAAGVESLYNSVLAGRDGRQTVEVDHGGRQIPLAEHPGSVPVPGRSVQLTLDRDIQWTAEQALKTQLAAVRATSGSVVVLDPQTGELLALATAPSFDADNPAAAPAADRGNPAVTDVYEPGSVNKVITAAAALENKIVTPDTPITVPPTLDRDDRTFHDAETHGEEHLTFAGVLAKSSNIGTILVAEQLGKRRLYDALHDVGFGAPTGLGLPGESAGILPPPDKWSDTQARTISFGQGISVTPLQVASVYGTVANDGVRVPPRIVGGTLDDGGHLTPAAAPPRTSVMSPSTAASLRDMLEAATSDNGTAPAARIDGYRVAGKTGTSQRVDPACGCYRGYTASFVGMAPADRPELVVAVIIQDPQNGYFGGAVAAPVFHDVMSFALQARSIPPTGTPAPAVRLTAN